MIVVKITEHEIANRHIGRQKIRVGKKNNFTRGNDSSVAKVFLWESLENTDEKSDLVIGNYCSISSEVEIFLGGTHNYKRASTHINSSNSKNKNSIFSKGNVEIKNDVYIGHRATILSGVTIGNGAIIATNAVVSKDVPDYSIVAGNPAKIIKYRFSEDTIERLLNTEWWNLPEEAIFSNSHLFFDQEMSEEVILKIEKLCSNTHGENKE